jgi:hypothetical protein
MNIIIITYCIIIIIVLLAYKYIKHLYDSYLINQENRYIIDPEEKDITNTNTNTNYITYNENIIYVFWNGGKRSTAYIFTLLLRGNCIVQPIYIMLDESEVRNIKRCRNSFNRKFPSLRARLLPTMYFTSIDRNNTVLTTYKKKKQQIMQDVWDTRDDIWVSILQCAHGFREKTFIIQWPFNKERLVYPIILELINTKYNNIELIT